MYANQRLDCLQLRLNNDQLVGRLHLTNAVAIVHWQFASDYANGPEWLPPILPIDCFDASLTGNR